MRVDAADNSPANTSSAIRCEAPANDVGPNPSSPRYVSDKTRFSAPRSVAGPLALEDKSSGASGPSMRAVLDYLKGLGLHEISAFSEVNKYSKEIETAAAETGVEARLIRAIMHKETTSGYYDNPATRALFGTEKSILPMNVNIRYWGEIFGTRQELNNPANNIKAGAEMLFRIISNLREGAPVSHIATLYNNSRATEVEQYGLRVKYIYDQQPWLTERMCMLK